MTCGSHEPAGSSSFQTWHEIERKRQVTKYQDPKIIQEKKLDCTKRLTCGTSEPTASSTFQRGKEIKRKRKVPKNKGQKKIKKKKLYCT
jgi:hypothetical protein